MFIHTLIVSYRRHADVVAIDFKTALISLGFAFVDHVEDERIVFVHLSCGMHMQVVLQGERVASEEQGVLREVFQEDFVILAQGVGDHDFAAHGVHHHKYAVFFVAQVADFQLSDFVGQADGIRRRLVFSVDFLCYAAESHAHPPT